MVLRYKQGPGSPTHGDREAMYIVTLTPDGQHFRGQWEFPYSDRPTYGNLPVLRMSVEQYIVRRIWVPLHPITLNLPSGA